jgi:hypothetical protein
MPYRVEEKIGGGRSRPAETTEGWVRERNGLIEHPNEAMGSSLLKAMGVFGQLIAGESFWRIHSVGAPGKEQPAAIFPLFADQVKPIPVANQQRMNAIPAMMLDPMKSNHWVDFYEVQSKPGLPDYIPAKEIVHIFDLPDPLEPFHGGGRLRSLQTEVSTHTRMLQWQRAQIENYAVPSGITVRPKNRDPKATADEFREKFSGPENAGRPMHLEEGENWIRQGFSPLELDLNLSIQGSATRIGMVFDYPAAIFNPTAQTLDNLRLSMAQIIRNGSLPLAQGQCEALALRLLTLEQRREHGLTIAPDVSRLWALQQEKFEKLGAWAESHDKLIQPEMLADYLDLPLEVFQGSDKPWKNANTELAEPGDDLDLAPLPEEI